MSDSENDSFKMDDSDNESESDNGLKRFMDEKDKEVAVKKVVNEVFSFSNGNINIYSKFIKFVYIIIC